MSFANLITQIENVNALGRENLAQKGVNVADGATTHDIMQGISTITNGNSTHSIESSLDIMQGISTSITCPYIPHYWDCESLDFIDSGLNPSKIASSEIVNLMLDTDGKFENALQFNNSKIVVYNDVFKLNDSTDVTFECWYKANTAEGNGTNCIFGFGKYDSLGSTSNVGGVIGFSNYNTVCFYRNGTVFDVDYPINQGEWYHFACVFGGAKTDPYIEVFVNGVSIVKHFTTHGDTSNKLTIGRNGDYTKNHIKASLDEIVVWDHARYTTNFTPPSEPYSNMIKEII